MADDFILSHHDAESFEQRLLKIFNGNVFGSFGPLLKNPQDVGTPLNVMVDQFVYPCFQIDLIPMIVTNAKIYRLKPSVTDLNVIRKASTQKEIADEMQWTWCYFDPSISQFDNNFDFINKHEKKEAELIYRYPQAKTRMLDFADRPNWILVANIEHLESVLEVIAKAFMRLRTIKINTLLKKRKSK